MRLSFKHSLKLRDKYLLALGLLFVVITASSQVMFTLIENQFKDPLLVNKAGMQRMLVQKVARHVIALKSESAEAAYHRKQLASAISILRSNHQLISLTHLDALPDNVVALMFSPPVALNSQVIDYAAKATQVLQASHNGTYFPAFYSPIEIDKLLAQLDQVVTNLQVAADDKVQELSQIVLVIWSVGCLLLLYEALFVFRPLANKVYASLESLEQETRRARESQLTADKANQSRLAFLKHINHELTVPVKGIFDALQMAVSAPASSSKQDLIQSALDSVCQYLELVTDLVELARVQTQEVTIKQEPFLLSSTVEQCLLPYVYISQNKGVHFHFNNQVHADESVIGDPMRLNQLLSHLVDGLLLVSNGCALNIVMKYVNDNHDAHVEFIIWDTGQGMSQKWIETLVDDELSLTQGVSVSLSRSLVSLLKGDLKVVTDDTSGTQIYLKLPLMPADLSCAKSEPGLQQAAN